MENRHRESIRKNWVFLTENLIPDEVLDHLLGNTILTQDLYEEVTVERTRKDKVTKFLFILQRRGPEAFGQLLLALRNTGQDFIADKLVETSNGQNNNINHPQPMQI